MSDPKFDDLFRSKLQAEEFAFEPEAWAEAEALLDAQKPVTRPLAWLWWLGGGLAVVVAAGALLLNNGHEPLYQPRGVLAANSSVEETVFDQEEIELFASKLEADDASSTEAEKTEKASSADEQSTSNLLSTTTTQGSTDQQTTSFENQPTSDNPGDQPDLQTPKPAQKPATDKPNLLASKPKQAPTTDNQDSQGPSAPINPSKIDPNTVSDAVLASLDPMPVLGWPWEVTRTAQLQQPTAANEFMSPMNMLPLVSRDHEELDDRAWKKPQFSRFSMSVLAGTSPSGGRPASTEQPTFRQVRPLGGLVLSYRLFEKVTLNANALYFGRDAWQQTHSYVSETYGFGVTREEVRLSPASLHFAELPIYLRLHLQRHRLLAGGTSSYLLGTKSTIDRTTSSLKEASTESSETDWGYTHGFNRLDLGLLLGYEYVLNTRSAVGMRYRWGLTDMTKDTYFTTDEKHTNSGFRFYLEYRIGR